MRIEEVAIHVGGNEKVSGIVNIPDHYTAETGVILAHGAANDMNNPVLAFVARGLAEAGILALRFNFLYRERGSHSLDGLDVLSDVWRAAWDFLASHPNYRPERIIAAGKSLGARVASQMAAEGRLPADRLIFLGYPLHPPGKKDQLRDSHLYGIRASMLFFEGSNDPFCDLDLLRTILPRLHAEWKLEIIPQGDHSFIVPETSSVSQDEVYGKILAGILGWLGR